MRSGLVALAKQGKEREVVHTALSICNYLRCNDPVLLGATGSDSVEISELGLCVFVYSWDVKVIRIEGQIALRCDADLEVCLK